MTARPSPNAETPADRHDRPLRESLRPRGPVRFELTDRREGNATVLSVAGELDVLTAPGLASRLDEVMRQTSGPVVIDLDEVEFVDSAGLHVLLNAQRRLTRRSRRLAVICKAGPVRRAIELARLIETLGVVSSIGQLTDRVQGRLDARVA